MDNIRTVDPRSPEYTRDYRNGWDASENYTDGALDRADIRNVSHAWYDGYADSSAGRPKYSWRAARRLGLDYVEQLPDEITDPRKVK